MSIIDKNFSDIKTRGTDFKNDRTIVLATTISLSRNVAGYKFVSKACNDELEWVMNMFRNKFLEDFTGEFDFTDPQSQDPFLSDVLVEKQLTSADFAEKAHPKAVFVSERFPITAIVNDINHLKIQITSSGLDTEYCWQQINEVDDIIEEDIEYAFSPQFGYLTANPKDTGTGLSASILLHLPSLAMQGKIGDIYDYADAKDLDVSGCRNDCDPEGDMFRISNRITIGKTELQIIDDVRKAALKISEYEEQSRKYLKNERFDILSDSTHRALGTLIYANIINYIEAANLLSKVRLGVIAGLIKGVEIERIDSILKRATPARLNYDNYEMLPYDIQEKLRAKMIRDMLVSR